MIEVQVEVPEVLPHDFEATTAGVSENQNVPVPCVSVSFAEIIERASRADEQLAVGRHGRRKHLVVQRPSVGAR